MSQINASALNPPINGKQYAYAPSTGEVFDITGGQVKQLFGSAANSIKTTYGSQIRQLENPTKTQPPPVAPGEPPDGGGSAPQSAEANNNIASGLEQFDPGLFGKKEKYQNLIYPRTMNSDQDRIFITQFQYKRSGVIQREGNFSSLLTEQNEDKTKKYIVGYVTLPMPNDISETNSVGWGEDSLSNMAALAMPKLVDAGIAAAGGNITGSVQDAFQSARNVLMSPGSKTRATQFLATKAAAGVVQKFGINVNPEAYITRSTGAAINPNLELLFNGPKLRQFGFQFKLTPRNREEAEEIRKIIRFFKQGMSPRKGSGDTAFFLGTPNIFKMQFKSGNNELKSIGRIKTCALVSFTANYTPDGFYAAYEDSSAGGSQPVSVTVQLGFTELTPIFNDEYDNNYDDIGPNVAPEEKNATTKTPTSNYTQGAPQGPTPGGASVDTRGEVDRIRQQALIEAAGPLPGGG